MTKHRWRGQVPMRTDKDGKIVGLSPDGDKYTWAHPLKWRKWHMFKATLLIDKIVRYGHVARFQATDPEKGRVYPLFMADVLDIMKRVGIEPGGLVTGTWGFCKRGARYGVYLMKGENDVEKVG